MKKLLILLKILSFALLIFIWDYVIISYRELPEIIPVHFGLNGIPDGFGNKNLSWLLPVLATLIFSLLFYVSKNKSSNLLNLPSKIKEDEKLSTFIIHFVTFLAMLIFSVITYESIRVALGKMTQLSPAIYFLMASLFLGIFGIVVYSSFFKKPETKTPEH